MEEPTKNKPNHTWGNRIGFFCCAVIPVAVIVYGIILLARGVQFNLRYGVTFLLVPLVAVGLLAWCIFSRCRPWVKGILCGGILVLFLGAAMFCLGLLGFVRVWHYDSAEAGERYAAMKEESPMLPERRDLSSATKTEYYTVADAFGVFFIAETDYMICTYTPEEYEIQKAKLETQYVFQTEPLSLEGENCAPMAEKDGYVFRMLSFDAYDRYYHSYPKRMTIIGYSDSNKEIVYMTYVDDDLDYITSMESFIDNDCGWRYIP